MAEPLAKLSTRGHIFEPRIEPQRIFLNATRPEPFDQKTGSILAVCRFISTLQLDHSFILLPGQNGHGWVQRPLIQATPADCIPGTGCSQRPAIREFLSLRAWLAFLIPGTWQTLRR